MTHELKTPLTNAQLDLLKMFARDIDEHHWVEIKRLATKYFAEKAIEEANKVWNEQGWDEQKINELLTTHMRTPYHPKNG